MSEERMAIKFAIKSQEFANAINTYSSEEMNEFDEDEKDIDFESFMDADYDGTVYTDNDIIIGSLIASEYDDMWDGWRPQKPIPEGKDVIGWILDVICHGDYEDKLSAEGKKFIKDNAESLEKSLKKYKIIHVEYLPFEESNIHYEEYDGTHSAAYSMYPDNWRSMWNKSNRADAQAVFEKHHCEMSCYSLDGAFAGDIFYDIHDMPVFLDLIRTYGDIKILNRGKAEGKKRVNSGIKNSIYPFFKDWEIAIDDIDFVNKTVCAGALVSCYDANEDAYYGDLGTPFDVAKTVIEHLGGKVTKSVSVKTDYVIISEYINSLGDRKSFYDWYKDELKRLKASVIEGNQKRKKKKLPEIGIIKEESLYDWLRIKVEELKETTDLFRPFGEIRFSLLPKDEKHYTSLAFKSELFFDIPQEQMRKAIVGIDSLSMLVSNIEKMTKAGVFSESGLKKNDYSNIFKMDELYKIQDYRSFKIKYESSNDVYYEVVVRY